MGNIVALHPPAPKEACDLMWKAHLCLLKADEFIRKADEACDAAGIRRDHGGFSLLHNTAKTAGGQQRQSSARDELCARLLLGQERGA